LSQGNVEIARALIDSWGRGEFWGSDYYDPDIEYVMEGQFFPDPGSYRGLENMARAWLEWLSAWDGFHMSEAELIECGDRVVALYTIQGRGKSSGIDVEAPVASIIDFRDGKVVRLVACDRDTGLEAAGIEDRGR
jgi:ketosteroid isomerase-like protein